MRVLIIGSGGREHAISLAISKSPLLKKLFIAPGNPGMESLGELVDIKVSEIDKLVGFAKREKIDLTIVGPENPLVEGIVDFFRENGLKIIGPDKKAARLEGSKAYSKEFMKKYNIPTADYKEVNDFDTGREVIKGFDYPLVIKADGLAAGKGVIICKDEKEALSGLKSMFKDEIFGKAGAKVVIEEFLEGVETSVIGLVDNKSIKSFVSSRDYKRALDNDLGLNTGGMGTYSPNLNYTREVEKYVEENILKPTLEGIKNENMDFRGIIFIGIMITKEGPKVLEYNVRLGDPETQVILTRLDSDLLNILLLTHDQRLAESEMNWKNLKSVCLILTSKGYPEDYEKGFEITGLDKLDEDILVFHSGTKIEDGVLKTNGGRVLGITALCESLEEAREKVYINAERVNFKGKSYRKDIGR